MQRLAVITAQLAPAGQSLPIAPLAGVPTAGASAPEEREVWIVGYARTPIGSGPVGGALSSLTAPELGALAIRSAVQRAGLAPEWVEEVYMGCVLTAGIGQAPARQAALKAGLSPSTPCTTVNKVCASGLKCVMLGAESIRAGSRDVLVVGGMESMSNAPFLLAGTRNGRSLKMGHSVALDALLQDGLTDAYNPGVHMGTACELTAQKLHISREEQDAYAKQSYERAQAATKEGRFRAEIVPVEIKSKQGKTVVVTEDEEVFRAKFDRFASLKPTFPTVIQGVSPAGQAPPVGTVTAANSSTIGDGAAALVLMSAQKARALGIKPLARVISHADAALPPLDYAIAPEKAIRQAVQKAGLASPAAVDLYEINEAFSAVALANTRLLQLSPDRVNVYGGGVSLGHPIGCSGARIVCTLISALADKQKQYGCAALCNGGGGASAVVIQKM